MVEQRSLESTPIRSNQSGTTQITPTTQLARKAAEAELERRVETLKEQLVETTQALQRLKSGKSTSFLSKTSPPTRIEKALSLDDDDDGDESESQNQRSPPHLPSLAVLPPPGKRGYLFKWQGEYLLSLNDIRSSILIIVFRP